MKAPESELKSFVQSFFKNLGAEVQENKNLLLVAKVPAEFESYSEKKSPYKLSFEKIEDESVEFITKGSVMLKSIMSYLESRGQTTLIKIKFEEDYKRELEKYFILRNSKMENFTKKANYKTFVRFSITTTLQYLNEKEQITNNIFVENGQIKDFNLEKYQTLPGKKEEIPKTDFKSDYEIAKEELKVLTKKRIGETAKNLGEKLDKEIARVKKHYEKQKEEFNHSLKRLQEQKKSYQNHLEKTKDNSFNEKISRVNDSIKQLESSNALQTYTKEEDFFIADEKQKHSLRINNKLINTTIFYYPIYTFDFILQSKESAKKIELVYDPMKDALVKSLFCESCKKEIREVFVCSSGHISCGNCREQCSICDSSLCLSCIKKRCDYCGKKLCKKCSSRCTSCYKSICKNHSAKNYADGKEYCLNCLERCESCGQYTNKSRMKTRGEQKICEKCFRTKLNI